MAAIEIVGGIDLDGMEVPTKRYNGDAVFAFIMRRVGEEGKSVGYMIESVYRDSNGIPDADITKACAQGLTELIKEMSAGDEAKEHKLLGTAAYIFIKTQSELQAAAMNKITKS